MKTKTYQDKLEKAELRVKTLEKINEKLRKSDLSENNKDIHYFSKSLHK